MAPMEGVSDTVFRRVVIRAGRPDLMFSEFTSADGMASRGYPYAAKRLVFKPEEQPLIAQIWGNRPENIFRAAKLVKNLGFDGIDINMGCPVRAVVSKGGGAALIGEPKLAGRMIEAARAGAEGLPVSVKTRLGIDAPVTKEWIGYLLKQELAAITVHGRTARELSKVQANWDEIGRAVDLKRQMGVKTLIIGNGDVKSRNQADDLVRRVGVDGVMIGRGVLENPWVFSGRNIQPSKTEKLALLNYHLDLFDQTWQNTKPWVTLRRFYKIYLRGFRGAIRLRNELMTAERPEQIRQILALA